MCRATDFRAGSSELPLQLPGAVALCAVAAGSASSASISSSRSSVDPAPSTVIILANSEAIAMNAGLPSSEVRSWQNCPGVAYPLAISLSTLSTMEWRPPSLDAGVLLTTEPAPQVKSFQPAVTMP